MGFILLMLSSKLGGSTLKQHVEMTQQNKIQKHPFFSQILHVKVWNTMDFNRCYFTIPMLSSKWGFSAKTENVEMAPHKKFKSTHA